MQMKQLLLKYGFLSTTICLIKLHNQWVPVKILLNTDNTENLKWFNIWKKMKENNPLSGVINSV